MRDDAPAASDTTEPTSSTGRESLPLVVYVLALLTMRLSKKRTLLAALVVFALGHVVVALSSDLTVLMGARFITALATEPSGPWPRSPPRIWSASR